jgi:hypothetical protein
MKLEINKEEVLAAMQLYLKSIGINAKVERLYAFDDLYNTPITVERVDVFFEIE